MTAMTDVTPLLEHYRETVRHLWNTGFLMLDTNEDVWHLRDIYSDVAAMLFHSFVLVPIGRQDAAVAKDYDMYPQPLGFLHVVPHGSETSLLINRAIPAVGYWDDPVTSLDAADTELQFIRYFDWDVVGMQDLEYYLVRITRSGRHPHLVGRDALVPVRDTRVLHIADVSGK
jgi:hypothetical protein